MPTPEEQERIDVRIKSCIDYLQEALDIMELKDEDMVMIARGNVMRVRNSLVYLRDKEKEYRIGLQQLLEKASR